MFLAPFCLGKLSSAELWLYYPGFAADFAESLAAVVGPADGMAAVDSGIVASQCQGDCLVQR